MRVRNPILLFEPKNAAGLHSSSVRRGPMQNKKLLYSTSTFLLAKLATSALALFSCPASSEEEKATVFAAVPSDYSQHADIKGLMSLRFDFPL